MTLGVAFALALLGRDAVAGQECQPATVVSGVDLNPAGNGTLTWSGSGKGFAIIKATQGNYYTDTDFAANYAALKSAGIVRGAYHFFDATVSGVDQANYFLSVVGTIQAGDMPPTLDIECPVAGDSNCLGNGSSGAASSSVITQAMNDFLNTIKTATGLTPIVYSFGSWFSDNGVDTTGLENYPLWLADYSGTNCFNVPTPWTAATFWQYYSSGTVSGVNVDDDYFLGSSSQLSAFTAGGGLPIDGGVGDSGSPDYGPCTVTTSGESGICIDNGQCASEGGTSTPGFCPGPANIECCTGIPTPDAGSSDAGGHPNNDAGEGTGGGGGGGTGGSGGGVIDGGPAGGNNGAQGPIEYGGGAGDGTRGCACTAAPDRSVPVGLGLALALTFGARVRRRLRP